MKEISKVKMLYENAKIEHHEFRKAFMNEFDEAMKAFLAEDYDEAQRKLKKGNELVTKSADARETMEQYKKELIKRHAQF